MGDLAFSINDLLWFIGACGAIWGVYKGWKAYVLKITKQEEAVDKLEKQMKELQESDSMVLKTLLALINHSIDGNGIEGMKKIRVSLEEYIVKK